MRPLRGRYELRTRQTVLAPLPYWSGNVGMRIARRGCVYQASETLPRRIGKRCGKSLLLELLTHLCFNATHSSIDPSPAFVFRDAERNCGTQLFDEMERLTEFDQKRHASLPVV